MKTVMSFLLAASVFIGGVSFGQVPPLQRNELTTNLSAALPNIVRDMVPTNNPIFTGTMEYQDAAGVSLSGQNITGSAGLFTSTFRLTPNAAVGKVMVSDATGFGAWSNPAFSPLATAQDFVLEDFSSYSATTSPTFNGGYGFAENGIYTSTAHIAPREMLDGRTRNVLRLLGKGDYVRKWPWGTNWLRMRVFFVVGITNSGNNITNAFAMGVCANGTNGGFFGNAASNVWAVGNAGQASSSQTMNYSNQLDVSFFDILFGDRSVIRTNNATVATTSGSGTAPRAYAALPHFYMHSLDLERPLTADRPTTNQALTISYRGAVMIPAANAFVITRRPGYQSVLADAANINSQFALQSAAVTFSSFTVNTRFFGEFDSIMFSWGSATNLAELWMAGAVKLY